ncbi:glycogen synthase GlgA [Sutcliffiella rhizosphaerae]|uniref:Glycogen synthase n=1 Tax=Sutcliffiella rhizosphaerae TaxID=2880967 RepID=A0ABN8AH23_9BACI|nr:glycogen synthase GlgA [Sutcliffiella rhizosphaerae]CAG9623666.1 Glycogen synthase [Sutcliffiella rhizosphaerae]
MKVLFVVSECVPFVKSGGLGDVAGALPKELKKLGTDVRVILPKYEQIPDIYRSKMKRLKTTFINVGWRNQYCGVEELKHDNVTYYFIDNEHYFKRDSLYGHYDDGERFSFFCRAVLESITIIDFIPDVIHCHDWHTGMVNFILEKEYKKNPRFQYIQSVFTIHNLQFQGVFPPTILQDLLNVEEKYFNPDELEFYGHVNFMKAALISSGYITTVSPTYKDEIQTPFFGEKLDGVLRHRNDSLVGIINGIDDELYNPETDEFIEANYSSQSIQDKEINKAALQNLCGLPVNADIPIIAMVSRLTKQKGLDLITRVFHEVLESDVQIVVLGTGEPQFEHYFRELAYQHPKKVRTFIGFDEPLAHQIYAGADMFLMPSQFEPCGLGQLIALRYGTIPIVRETGGLNDTVNSYDDTKFEGNGFSFTNFNAHDMLHTIRRAIGFYEKHDVWKIIMKEAMERDYSWAKSAFKYNQLYSSLMARSGMSCSQTKKNSRKLS